MDFQVRERERLRWTVEWIYQVECFRFGQNNLLVTVSFFSRHMSNGF